MAGSCRRRRIAVCPDAKCLQLLLQCYQVIPACCLHDLKCHVAELRQALCAVLHLLGVLVSKLFQAVDLQAHAHNATSKAQL